MRIDNLECVKDINKWWHIVQNQGIKRLSSTQDDVGGGCDHEGPCCDAPDSSSCKQKEAEKVDKKIKIDDNQDKSVESETDKKKCTGQCTISKISQ